MVITLNMTDVPRENWHKMKELGDGDASAYIEKNYGGKRKYTTESRETGFTILQHYEFYDKELYTRFCLEWM